jgi:hypothetical protein
MLPVMGILFLFIVYVGEVYIPIVNKLADTTWGIIREIMLVTGWVFIWYVVENIIFDRRKLLEKRRDNIQMLNAIFLFENENEYYKILEEEQKEEVKEKEVEKKKKKKEKTKKKNEKTRRKNKKTRRRN